MKCSVCKEAEVNLGARICPKCVIDTFAVDPEIDERIEQHFNKPVKSRTIYPCPECKKYQQEITDLKKAVNTALNEKNNAERVTTHNEASVAVAAQEALTALKHKDYDKLTKILQILMR